MLRSYTKPSVFFTPTTVNITNITNYCFNSTNDYLYVVTANVSPYFIYKFDKNGNCTSISTSIPVYGIFSISSYGNYIVFNVYTYNTLYFLNVQTNVMTYITSLNSVDGNLYASQSCKVYKDILYMYFAQTSGTQTVASIWMFNINNLISKATITGATLLSTDGTKLTLSMLSTNAPSKNRSQYFDNSPNLGYACYTGNLGLYRYTIDAVGNLGSELQLSSTIYYYPLFNPYNDYLYVINSTNLTVDIWDVRIPTIIGSYTSQRWPHAFDSIGNYYNSPSTTSTTSTGVLNSTNPLYVQLVIVCFMEDTQILTINGYKLIQDLKKGDLVQTLKNGCKPIYKIGTTKINHQCNKERIKDQLYKCSNENFPEIFEDLVITGCHSILVDKFKNEEERQKSNKLNGSADDLLTENKYRLPACIDERTSVYEIPGTHNIYHFALENDDYYMNYGVYANGLLVETTSKRCIDQDILKEIE